jgi:hypothetical protein
MTLADLQRAFSGLPQVGPLWPWERRLLHLIMNSEKGIDAFEVVHAVIDNPDRVSRMLQFLRDDDIYRIRSLAATIQPANQDLCMTIDLLSAWACRQTIKKALPRNPDE